VRANALLWPSSVAHCPLESIDLCGLQRCRKRCFTLGGCLLLACRLGGNMHAHCHWAGCACVVGFPARLHPIAGNEKPCCGRKCCSRSTTAFLHFALQFWRWYFRIPIFSLNLAFSTRSLKGLWVIISFSSCGVYLIIFNSSSEELDVYDSSFDVDCSLKFRCCPSSDYSMKMVAKIGRVDVGLGIFNIYRQSSKFIYVSYRSKLNSSLGRPIAFLSN